MISVTAEDQLIFFSSQGESCSDEEHARIKELENPSYQTQRRLPLDPSLGSGVGFTSTGREGNHPRSLA